MKKLYRIHFIAIAVIDLLLFAFFIPNHSYLSQLDVTYKTPDLMSHFLPPHEPLSSSS
ncbi:putative glutamine transport system permease protein [Streptococcus pneumoniae]|nr:putative glutamine transport system permease protein [Streptococcus pneumoniae]